MPTAQAADDEEFGEVAAPHELPSGVAAPTASTTAAPVRTVEPVLASFVAEPPIASAAAPVQSTSAPALEPTVEPTLASSWWEHWSSGVVLIVLVIALVAASIIAFTDSGSADPDMMAERESEARIDSDLSTAGLPTIELPNLDMADVPSVPVVVESTSPALASSAAVKPSAAAKPSEGSPAEKSLVSDTPAAAATAGGIAETDLGLATPLSSSLSNTAREGTSTSGTSTMGMTTTDSSVPPLPTETESIANGSEIASRDDASTKPSASAHAPLSLLPEDDGLDLTAQPDSTALQTESTSGTNASTAASLQPPIATLPSELFPQPAETASRETVPTLPVSSPSRATQPPGASPTLYDGAASSGAPAGSLAMPSDPSSLQTPAFQPATNPNPDLANPGIPAELASAAAGNLPTQTASLQTRTEEPTGTPESSGTKATQASAPPAGVIATDTPEFDQDAIIQAYQHFYQLQQNQNASTNRYVPNN